MRTQGKIANHEIRNLTQDQTRQHLELKHKALYEKHGPGVFNAVPLDREGAIEWTYDYAGTMDPKTGIVSDGSADDEETDSFQFSRNSDEGFYALLRRALVFIKNGANIKQVPDGDQPSGSHWEVVEEGDVSSQERCDVINYFESFLHGSTSSDFSGYADTSFDNIDGVQGDRVKPLEPATEDTALGGTSGNNDEAGNDLSESHSTVVEKIEGAEA